MTAEPSSTVRWMCPCRDLTFSRDYVHTHRFSLISHSPFFRNVLFVTEYSLASCTHLNCKQWLYIQDEYSANDSSGSLKLSFSGFDKSTWLEILHSLYTYLVTLWPLVFHVVGGMKWIHMCGGGAKKRWNMECSKLFWILPLFTKFVHFFYFFEGTFLKGASTCAKNGPFFSADFEKSTSFGAKLELKKGAFSAPCQRSLN